MNNYQIQRNKLKLYINKLLYSSIIPLLAKGKISPNTITIIGFVFSLITMILISQGYLLISGILIIISSIFDLLDGALARYTNNTTNFGKFIDAVIDRLSEIAIYVGLFIYFINEVLLCSIVVDFNKPANQVTHPLNQILVCLIGSNTQFGRYFSGKINVSNGDQTHDTH